jgi:nitric oxide synthase oxygenase domain/subunit
VLCDLQENLLLNDHFSRIQQICVGQGWQPKNGRFDVLPLVLQANGEEPEVFEIPEDLILEVNITHPE